MRSLGLFLAVVTALSVIACSSEQQESSPGASDRFKPTTSMMNTMNWILDPSADVIWGNAGWEIDENGERELFPRTNEEWNNVRNAAAMVAETGNLLMISGRPDGVDDRGEDWISYSQAIVDVGNQLIDAAQRHDKQAIFDLGGTLYRVCVACHTRYAYEPEPQ